MAVPADKVAAAETLRTLPGDDVRQILWRMSDRYDLQMLVQSVRQVARGPVARMVAEGARNTHDWTEKKNALLGYYDECGVTGVFMEPHQGGFIEGPKMANGLFYSKLHPANSGRSLDYVRTDAEGIRHHVKEDKDLHQQRRAPHQLDINLPEIAQREQRTPPRQREQF